VYFPNLYEADGYGCPPNYTTTFDSLFALDFTDERTFPRVHAVLAESRSQHPDQFYQAGSEISSGCHDVKRKPKKGERAGVWGTHHSYVLNLRQPIHSSDVAPVIRDCDSPLRLYNLTMNWLEEEWANEVDFVICVSIVVRTWHNLWIESVHQGLATMLAMTLIKNGHVRPRKYMNLTQWWPIAWHTHSRARAYPWFLAWVGRSCGHQPSMY